MGFPFVAFTRHSLASIPEMSTGNEPRQVAVPPVMSATTPGPFQRPRAASARDRPFHPPRTSYPNRASPAAVAVARADRNRVRPVRPTKRVEDCRLCTGRRRWSSRSPLRPEPAAEPTTSDEPTGWTSSSPTTTSSASIGSASDPSRGAVAVSRNSSPRYCPTRLWCGFVRAFDGLWVDASTSLDFACRTASTSVTPRSLLASSGVADHPGEQPVSIPDGFLGERQRSRPATVPLAPDFLQVDAEPTATGGCAPPTVLPPSGEHLSDSGWSTRGCSSMAARPSGWSPAAHELERVLARGSVAIRACPPGGPGLVPALACLVCSGTGERGNRRILRPRRPTQPDRQGGRSHVLCPPCATHSGHRRLRRIRSP